MPAERRRSGVRHNGGKAVVTIIILFAAIMTTQQRCGIKVQWKIHPSSILVQALALVPQRAAERKQQRLRAPTELYSLCGIPLSFAFVALKDVVTSEAFRRRVVVQTLLKSHVSSSADRWR